MDPCNIFSQVNKKYDMPKNVVSPLSNVRFKTN